MVKESPGYERGGGQERSLGDLFSIGRQSRIHNRSPTQDALIGSVVHCGTTEASCGFSILGKSQPTQSDLDTHSTFPFLSRMLHVATRLDPNEEAADSNISSKVDHESRQLMCSKIKKRPLNSRKKTFQFRVSLKDGHFAINFFQRLPTKLMYCTQTQFPIKPTITKNCTGVIKLPDT